MEQIFSMKPNEIRDLAREYIRQGVVSRAIQCFERLLWLGKLRQREYLRLMVMYKAINNILDAERVIKRYKAIYI